MQEKNGENHDPTIDTEFCRQEFSELRQEIVINTEEKRRLERFCLIGAAVVFSWVATEAPKSGPDSKLYFAAFVPSVLVGFGWLKSTALESTIMKIGKYIYELEERLSPNGEGWEHYYEKQRKTTKVSPERISGYFWPLLMASTLIGAFILNADSKIGDWLLGN